MSYNIYKSASTGTGILVDDDGQLYIISKNDKKIWTGKLEEVAWPDSKPVVNIDRVNPLVNLAVNDRSFLEDIGMEAGLIDDLAKNFEKD